MHQAAEGKRLRTECDELQAELISADTKLAAAEARAEGVEAELEDAQVCPCIEATSSAALLSSSVRVLP